MNVFLCLVMLAAVPSDSEQKGMSYCSWWCDDYLQPHSDTSLQMLRDLVGAEWISLLVTWYQDSLGDTLIRQLPDKSPTDASVRHAIGLARSIGLRVMLKPHVDVPNAWRGEIVPDANGAWFRSYRRFIFHYAAMAETLGCEQFCTGTELEKTTRGHETEWRAIIDTVRQLFHGPLVYAANHDRYDTMVGFWDALDLVGIDAYFGLTHTNTPTVAQLESAWVSRVLPRMDSFQRRVGKPIVFTEIGYRSVDSCNVRPWDYSMQGPVDTAEQRDCYEAAFNVFWSAFPWFRGFYWWDWTTFPNQGGPQDADYTPHGKPAERVLIQHYSAVAEHGHGEFFPPRLRVCPTIVRGVLCLPEARGESRESRGELLDVSGRHVLDLHPAANRVQALAPGVYFVREAQAQAVRKVLLLH